MRADLDHPLRRRGGGRAGRPVQQPAHSPTRTPAQVEQRIIQLRSRERRGPAWIGAELGVPARTVSRVPARRGQPRRCAADPMTGEVIRSSKTAATRYERCRPGELVHMDVKEPGRIPDGGGWWAHGRGVGEAAEKMTPLGCDHVHPCSKTTPGWPVPRS